MKFLYLWKKLSTFDEPEKILTFSCSLDFFIRLVAFEQEVVRLMQERVHDLVVSVGYITFSSLPFPPLSFFFPDTYFFFLHDLFALILNLSLPVLPLSSHLVPHFN